MIIIDTLIQSVFSFFPSPILLAWVDFAGLVRHNLYYRSISLKRFNMSLQRHWKDAATLLLVAKLPKYERGFNYKILLMKRSATSKFMANAAVFPGGTSDKADFSVQWEPQLLKFKRPTESLLAKFSRPPMFKSPEFDGLSPELGFRICAVRETFEEAGVPLFKTAGGSDLNPAEGPNDVVKQIGQHVLAEWRKKVQEDGSQFIKMCAELQLVPDIWSLKTWSNWLTPTHMQSQHGKSSRRFDTVFYTCCLPYVPEYFHDDTEIISSEVCFRPLCRSPCLFHCRGHDPTLNSRFVEQHCVPSSQW